MNSYINLAKVSKSSCQKTLQSKGKISKERIQMFIDKIINEKCNIQMAGIEFNINKASAKRIWQKYRKDNLIASKKISKPMPKNVLIDLKLRKVFHKKMLDLPKMLPTSTNISFYTCFSSSDKTNICQNTQKPQLEFSLINNRKVNSNIEVICSFTDKMNIESQE